MEMKLNDQELIKALKRISVTGDQKLKCLGCGYEHNCSLHGCRIIRQAAERLEALSDKESRGPVRSRETGGFTYRILTMEEYFEAEEIMERLRASLPEEKQRLLDFWMLQVAVDSLEYYHSVPELPEEWCSEYEGATGRRYTEDQRRAFVDGLLFWNKVGFEDLCDLLVTCDLVLRLDLTKFGYQQQDVSDPDTGGNAHD